MIATLCSQRFAWMRNAVIAAALMLSLFSISLSPAFAETAGQRSTRNIILAAAAVTGIVLYKNWLDKKAQANTVVGYTPDGGVVYGDGRIVYKDGVVAYASNDGHHRCHFADEDEEDGQRCMSTRLHAYFIVGYQPPPGWYKRHHHHEDNDENNGNHEGEHNGHGNGDDH